MKYIYHHLGLGDHIICNGLVRSLINPGLAYSMFVKPHNLTAVRFMYRDLPNLQFLVGDDKFARGYISGSALGKEELITAGFTGHPDSKHFDEAFYLQHGLSPSDRWTKFRVDRDFDRERKFFEKFHLKEGEYVFVHDDESRDFRINEDLIANKDLPVVRPKPGLTDNIFDYCYLMQKSAETHFIDSSFRLVFDALRLREDNIYYHLRLKNGKGRNGDVYVWADAVNSCLKFKIFD